MVAFDTRRVHEPNDIEALLRVSAITDEISRENMSRASAILRITKHGVEGFKVAVNIGHDRHLHPPGE